MEGGRRPCPEGEGGIKVTRECMDKGSIDVMWCEVWFVIAKEDMAKGSGVFKAGGELVDGQSLWNVDLGMEGIAEAIVSVQDSVIVPAERDET